MNIGEEQLKKLVLRILEELKAEKGMTGKPPARQKIYMVCSGFWDERYAGFLKDMENSEEYEIYPVIPASWQKQGHEAALRNYQSCRGIVYRACRMPEDLEQAITVFPASERDVIVKTALCISDTFETSWIARCIEKGSRILFLRTGLKKFSGRETPAYMNQIMEYYRRVLEYGVEICGVEDLYGKQFEGSDQTAGKQTEGSVQTAGKQPDRSACMEEISKSSHRPPELASGKKRVITASTVEQFASGGVLCLRPDDIVTDLAKDRAEFLNIVFR